MTNAWIGRPKFDKRHKFRIVKVKSQIPQGVHPWLLVHPETVHGARKATTYATHEDAFHAAMILQDVINRDGGW